VTITPTGGRVLGCLAEKQLTTPQQYPLTANALLLACNQASNRDPVVTLDDAALHLAIDELRSEHLVRVVLPSHGRSVKRYRHALDEVYALDTPARALLAVLLLRGPQTPGELRARTERMAEFATVGELHEQLDFLANRSEGLVQHLPRRPGQKEDRWQQVLAAEWADGSTGLDQARDNPDPDDLAAVDPLPRPGSGPAVDAGGGELAAVHTEVASLRAEVTALADAVTGLSAALDTLRRSLGD
jgi:uncharacterized protein YceH (UPF0502 family)